jgi:hypothetical protein
MLDMLNTVRTRLRDRLAPVARHDDQALDGVYFYTRFGLGVSDERWMDFRLSLFQAVTLPSIARFCRNGARWVLFVDTWMRPRHLETLRAAIASVPGGERIHIEAIDVMVQMRARMSQLTAGLDQVTLVRIDDDDALPEDFFDGIPLEPGVYTRPDGYEVALADGVLRAHRYPFHSMNTVATMPQNLVRKFLHVSHSKTYLWAEEHGLPAHVLDDGEPSYLYTRHKLADNKYRALLPKILQDENRSDLTPELRRRFGLDEAALERWLAMEPGVPDLADTKTRTWNMTTELNQEALRLVKQLEAVHGRIWDATGDLLEPEG